MFITYYVHYEKTDYITTNNIFSDNKMQYQEESDATIN